MLRRWERERPNVNTWIHNEGFLFVRYVARTADQQNKTEEGIDSHACFTRTILKRFNLLHHCPTDKAASGFIQGRQEHRLFPS